jgi:hypothetical protein
VWDHASDGLVENTGRSAEMEGATTGRVVSGDLAEVGMVLHCSSALVVLVWRVGWYVCETYA